jgi:hypothetical protein
MINNSLTNNEILINALKNETLISFRLCSTPHYQESNVKIVKINLDDCENKNFIFETSKGERYNAYSNNIFFN